MGVALTGGTVAVACGGTESGVGLPDGGGGEGGDAAYPTIGYRGDDAYPTIHADGYARAADVGGDSHYPTIGFDAGDAYPTIRPADSGADSYPTIGPPPFDAGHP
jgi:hypothetical protein